MTKTIRVTPELVADVEARRMDGESWHAAAIRLLREAMLAYDDRSMPVGKRARLSLLAIVTEVNALQEQIAELEARNG